MNSVDIANVTIHILTLIGLVIFLSGLKRSTNNVQKNLLRFVGRYIFLFYFFRLLNFMIDWRIIDIILLSMAAFIPLVMVLMLEYIEKRHAPLLLKLVPLIAGTGIMIATIFNSDLIESRVLPNEIMLYQLVFVIVLIAFVRREIRSISNPASRALLRRFQISAVLALPLIFADYGLVGFLGSLKLSNLIILLFIWLSYDRSGDRRNLVIKISASLVMLIASFVLSYSITEIFASEMDVQVELAMMLLSSALLICVVYSEVNIRVRTHQIKSLDRKPSHERFEFVSRNDIPDFELADEILEIHPVIGFADLERIKKSYPLGADFLRHLLLSHEAVFLAKLTAEKDQIVFLKQSSIFDNLPNSEDLVQLFQLFTKRNDPKNDKS